MSLWRGSTVKCLPVLMLWAIAATPARAEADRALLLGLSASILKIEVLREQGGFSLGSGVVVAPEKIATNCHVTRDALKINVLRGGLRWPARSQLSDVEHDLCVLDVPGLQAGAVPLGRAATLAAGQPVTALGYTGGLGLQHTEGEVLGLHRFDGGRVIQSSNWFSSGASGGALFDADLQLVGILTFRLRGGEAHSFAAPAEWLRAMLDAPAAPGYVEVRPDRSLRLAYWQQPAADQPRFLQAALLQRDDRWSQLESLATGWASADANDPEPWYLMGVALARMNRMPEAQRAWACALAIDPALAPTMQRLAGADGPPSSRQRSTAPVEPGTRTASAPPGLPAAMSAEPPCVAHAPAARTP